jgi:hypothetical protein
MTERTQVLDRTQLLTAATPAAPRPRPVARTTAETVVPQPPRNNWTLVAGILLALGVLVVAGLLVGRSSSGGGAVPDKVSVHPDVPNPVKRDVARLQDLVSKK